MRENPHIQESERNNHHMDGDHIDQDELVTQLLPVQEGVRGRRVVLSWRQRQSVLCRVLHEAKEQAVSRLRQADWPERAEDAPRRAVLPSGLLEVCQVLASHETNRGLLPDWQTSVFVWRMHQQIKQQHLNLKYLKKNYPFFS